VAHTDRLRLFRVPFVEYARGDGLHIGPGQEHAWSPVLLDPVPSWAGGFRGLWGFYARDPLAGEDSPAGPMFERDGSPRPSWQDPLRWAGLDGVPTPRTEHALLARRRVELLGHQRELDTALADRLDRIESLSVDLAALRDEPHLQRASRELTERRHDLRREIDALRRERTETAALIDAVEERQARLSVGIADPPTAHASKLAQPVPEPSYRWRRLAEIWSALSVASLVASVLWLLLTDGSQAELAPHLLVLVVAFLIVDAFLRQQVASVVSVLAVVLAAVCALIVVVHFLWHIVVGTIILAVLYLAWTNIREVFR
jgi:hypothetical protein